MSPSMGPPLRNDIDSDEEENVGRVIRAAYWAACAARIDASPEDSRTPSGDRGMSFEVELLVYGAAVPLFLAIALLVLGRQFLPTGIGDRTGAAAALAFGFGTAAVLFPWFPWKPEFAWHWLPYLGLLAAIAGGIGPSTKVPSWGRWLLWLGLAGVSALVIVPTWEKLESDRLGYIVGLASTFFVLIVLLDPLAARLAGNLLPTHLAITATVGAVILGLSGSAKYAQLGGAVAAAMGGCAIVGWFRQEMTWLRGAMPAFVVLLGGLMFTGYISSFTEIPWLSYLLVPLAPLMLWAGVWLPLGSLKGIWRMVAQFGLILIPLGIALALAASLEQEEW